MLIDEVVGTTVGFEPIALIGPGGVGKTSIALKALHDGHTKRQFRDNRRFIRCDAFPASRAHFLAHLSKAIGASVENPEDMAPLRPFLSSTKMLIVLDNVESILDPQGINHQELFAAVDELCRFSTVCVCITSRISAVPRCCLRLLIPTLPMEAACDTFYNIYGGGRLSPIVYDLFWRLGFHALSITLLATTASDNVWDHDRLAKEWDIHRAKVLRTDHNESLAATIELSLASPTFSKLGPNARDLLGVIAFFPHGVDERSLDWLFPTIPDRKNIFDKFCALSLTYRSNDTFMMLAPIREYLRPRGRQVPPFLHVAKDRYFARLSVRPDPNQPRFEEAQWFMSEDVNVEHLLDVFTLIDRKANDVWDACVRFMEYLCWQKPRQTTLKSKIECLPNGHPSKAECLFWLSRLSGLVGNQAEQKLLLIQVLTLERKRGNNFQVAVALGWLSHVNRALGLHGEGISQAEEALGMFNQLGSTLGQATCYWLLLCDNHLDAAEDTALREVGLLPTKGHEYLLCQSHHLLGNIYYRKGEKEKAVDHFETALTTASPFNWHDELYRVHHAMAALFSDEDEFDDANTHIEAAKLHVGDHVYNLGQVMGMQSVIWHRQSRLEDARSEGLRALEIYEGLRVAKDVEGCRSLLWRIEKAIGS